MKHFKKNKLLISILVFSLIIFTFFTGTITNCASNGEVYTSYFSFNIDHKDDYQALYFSQSKGIFYGVYGKIDLDTLTMKHKGMHLKVINYQRILPFTQEIGFHSEPLSASLLYQDVDTLKFNLILDKFWSSKKEAYIKFTDSIDVQRLKYFKIKRYFSDKDIGEKRKNPCYEKYGQNAIGLNCIESDLQVVH